VSRRHTHQGAGPEVAPRLVSLVLSPLEKFEVINSDTFRILHNRTYSLIPYVATVKQKVVGTIF
jgi:hypothetical protein